MSLKNEPSDSEAPRDKKSADKNLNFDKVVDELRSVLAGLNQPQAPVPSTPPPSPEPVLSDDTFLRAASPVLPPADEPEKLGEEAFRKAADVSQDPPSDQDFWNGNVLGWPHDGEKKEDEPAPAVPEKHEPSLADRLWLETPVEEDIPQVFPSTLAPAASGPAVPESKFRPIEDFDLPQAPTPPSTDEDADVPPARIPLPADMGFPPASIPPELLEPAASPEEPAPTPSRTVLPTNLKVPIPGTLHQLPTGRNKPGGGVADPTLEEMGVHQGAVLSIACMFPEGKEAVAQDFLLRLKAAAQKTNGAPKLDAVLMNPWASGQINLANWKKAASLSGASFLFVLAPKKDKDHFRDLARVGHQDEIRSRLVALEQIPLRTLYADLLAEVLRGQHGQS